MRRRFSLRVVIRDEERFLSAQPDTFAGANVKEKASGCSVRNDGGVVVRRGPEVACSRCSMGQDERHAASLAIPIK
jgi:hypothetical protein